MAQVEYDLGSLESKEWKRIWVSPNGYGAAPHTGAFTLDESFFNYQEIMFVCARIDTNILLTPAIFTTSFVKDFYLSGISQPIGFMINGYSTEYSYFKPKSNTSFEIDYHGVGIYAVYVR